MQTSNGVYNRCKQTLPCTITIIAQNYNATKLQFFFKFLKQWPKAACAQFGMNVTLFSLEIITMTSQAIDY